MSGTRQRLPKRTPVLIGIAFALFLFSLAIVFSAVSARGINSGDLDGDGITNALDNCVLVANADQRDTNGDQYGNACDSDLNNDGDVNFVDLGIIKAAFFSAPGDANYNPDAELTGDDVINFFDLVAMKAAFFGQPGPSGPLPLIDVSNTSLGFGEVLLGDDNTVSFTVSNPGWSPLTVTSINDTGAPFSVFPPTSFTMMPGDPPRTVQVEFAPLTDGFFAGTLNVNSNADLTPTINIGLNGVGRDPNPDEMPDISVAGSLEFGPVPEGLFSIKKLTVVNLGAGPLTVNGLVSTDGNVVATPLTGGLPIVVSPNQSRQLSVRFDPPAGSAGSTFSGNVSVSSNDPDTPVVTVAFTGQAVLPVPTVNVPVVSARVRFNPFDQITAATCSGVGGEIQFGAGSLATDFYRVALTDQQGQMVAGAPAAAPMGAALEIFSGIDACALADGVIDVRVILTRDSEDLPPYLGTPAAKNTGALLPPVLDPVEPATAMSFVQVCGTSREDTTLRITGGTTVVSATLDAATTTFCLNVPLRPNQQNTLIATAIDNLAVPPKPVATAAPVQVVQVNPADIIIAEATSQPLDENEIAELVANGVIALDDPSNYNVSIFTIVFTVGSFPVTVSAPVATPIGGGQPVVGGGSWNPGGGTGGSGSGGQPPPPTGCISGCTGIVAVPMPDGSTVPGVIIIDGRILTLKEFFQVTLALLNSSPTFSLTDVEGRVDLPAGLTPIAAGLGLDVSAVNAGGTTDSVVIGQIDPGNTGTGQFIVRGDSIGTYNVDVDFDGFLTGGALPSPLAFAGSAGTTVQVFGPPELGVVVRHPSDPFGPDVELNEVYDLIVEITNVSTRPALYTSLDLFVGGDSRLLDDSGLPLPQSNDVRDFGTIPPGGTVAATFRVQSLAQGELIACQAIASENISLTVDTGPDGTDCNIANTIPAGFQPLPVDQPPTIFGINPLNGQGNIPSTSSVIATLTPESVCIIADTWTNVVTQAIGGNPANGFEIVSADFVAAGTFYVEELDAFGDPVAHIPTDLTAVSPPAGGTTIATLRLGLAAPLSQTFLKSNTTYRATLLGANSGEATVICNAANMMPMASTFQWTFSTEQNCGGLSAPIAALAAPSDGSIDQPLNQQIVLDFTNRMNLGSLAFNPIDLASSTIGFYSGATEVAGDLNGEIPLPGSASFTNLNRKLTFTPTGNLPTDEIIHIRLTDGLEDECGNPLQTPPIGVRLFSFQTIPPDSIAPAAPLVNPVPVLTSESTTLVSGSAEPSSTVDVQGGATSAASSVAASGLFTVSVPLTPDQSNALMVTATDASNNTSAPPVLNDVNGDPLVVFYDATPPGVIAQSPADGAIDVLVGTPVLVQFNEGLLGGSVNSLNFALENAGADVPGTFALNGTDGFTFTPDALLHYATTYTVRMRANGIRDVAGNGFAADLVSSFTTEVPPPPVINTLLPDSAVQGETLSVTFTGAILGTASAVVSDNPNISGSITNATDTSVTALIVVESLAAVGPTTLGLTTMGGTTSLPFAVVPKPPVITGLVPAAGQRGSTVSAQINGTGLTGITSLTIGGTGVTLNDLTTGDDTVRDVEFVIAPDAPLGPRTVTVITDGGSDTTTFIVDIGTGHYFRFEGGSFLADSIGGATLQVTGATQVTLPSGGRGADFPAILDVTGGGANVEATELTGTSRLATTLTSGVTGSFTIEAFAHFDTLSGPGGSLIAGTVVDGNSFGWTFQARIDGSGGLQPRELAIFYDTGPDFGAVGSGIIMQTGIDYYVAAAFDLGGSQVTFYVQDLTNGGPLQVVNAGHGATSINAITSFEVGGSVVNGFFVDGIIDEVRLSDSVLNQGDLLISNAINPVISLDPPASIVLTRTDVPLTVSIDVPAPPGGQSIALSSDDPSVTVPPSVIIPEGMLSASVTATTGNVAVTANISATAAGYVGGSSQITVQLRSLSIQVPLVGLEQTVAGTLTLSQPAPTGGVNVDLSVDDINIATVSPASVFVPQGASSANFDVTGGMTIGTATVNADASAEGYGLASTVVDVTNRQIDMPESRLLALQQVETFNVLVSPDPAPAGGLDINIVSSDPGVVEVLTPVVTILEGDEFVQVSLRGLTRGAATVTASNAGFLSDSTSVAVTATIVFLGSPPTIDDADTIDLWMRADSGGAMYPAPAPGIDLTVASSDTDCVSVTSPAAVATGDSFASASVSYGGVAALPCTATVSASNADFDDATIDVTVDAAVAPIGSLSVSQWDSSGYQVGAGLQTRFYVTLDNAAHGGITVVLRTSDATRARLSSSSLMPGAPVMEVSIADGSTSSSPFYVQGLAGVTGSVNLEATEPQFNDGLRSIKVNPVALVLGNLVSTTTSLSASVDFFARTYVLDETGTTLQFIQQVSPAAGAQTVTFTSDTPAVGQLVTNAVPGGAGSVTVQIQPGVANTPFSLGTGGVQFDPLGGGQTTVTASAPDYTALPQYDTQTVTVTQPDLNIFQWDSSGDQVGAGLQTRFYVTLGGSQHGGVTVELSSSDTAKVKFATDATTPGTDTLNLTIADGSTQSSPFYVQGVVGASGAVDLTASQALFNDGVRSIKVNPVALVLGNLVSTTTSLSASGDFYARTYVLDETGTALQFIQQVSPAAGAQTVTFTSDTPAVGQLVTNAVPGGAGSVTVQIQPGVANTPFSLGTGGVQFDPLGGGQTTVTASAPGYTALPQYDTQTVTVTQPDLNIFQWDGNGDQVGAGLQTRFYVTLGGSQHGGVTVELSSSDTAKVKFATDATTPGTDTLNLTIADGSTQSSPFYVQGVVGASGAVDLTASQALFNDGVRSIKVNPVALVLGNLVSTTTSLSASGDFYARTYVLDETGTALQFIQQVSPAAGAQTVTFTSDTPAVGQLVTNAVPGGAGSVTVQIQPGVANTPFSLGTGGVQFDPLGGGQTTVTASAPGYTALPQYDTQTVTVTQPDLNIFQWDGNGDQVGAGLQTRFYVTLGGSQHGGVTVELSSSDTAKVKFATDATTPGTDTLNLTIADGSTQSSPFYVQGVVGANGAVDLTASQALFNDGVRSIKVNPVALVLGNLVSTTTSLSASGDFYARTYVLDETGTALQFIQQVSPAAGAQTVTFTSDTPAVGQLVTNAVPGGAGSVTVQIQPGVANTPFSLGTGGVQFDPLGGGQTTVTASAPGYTALPQYDTQTVTVTQPDLNIFQWDGNGDQVGAGLQTRFYVSLTASDHGGVTVRVTSDDPTRLKMAPDGNTPGEAFIDLLIPDGSTGGSNSVFYVQGISDVTGLVDVTASEQAMVPRFNEGLQTVTVVQPVLDITGLGTGNTASGANDAFYARTYILNSGGTGLQYNQAVSAGEGPLTVVFASSDPAVGRLVTNAVPGGAGTVTADIPVNGLNTPTTLATDGVEFDPVATGTTDVSVTANGFGSFSSDTETVTISP